MQTADVRGRGGRVSWMLSLSGCERKEAVGTWEKEGKQKVS